jgi:type IV pilus assembly protein PilC
MRVYSYAALDIQGKEFEGQIESLSQSQVIRRLREMGLFPTLVKERIASTKPRKAVVRQAARRVASSKGVLFGTGIKVAQVAAFTRQLSTLIEAGIPLVKGLIAIERQERNRHFRTLQHRLIEAIEGGSLFSEALAAHPRVFSKLYVNMVVAGETGGMLDQTLARLADLMERTERLKAKVKASMFYPTAVITVAIGILSLLILFVVPRFQMVFADLTGGKGMPWFTQFVIDVAQGARKHALLILLACGAVVALGKLIQRTRLGRRVTDRVQLWLPIVGDLCSKVAVSRACRTLGTLLQNGVPILQSIAIARETATNSLYAGALDRLYQQVKEGENVTPTLETSGLFPSTVISMIDVGEQTGALPTMMLKVADTYDEAVDHAMNGLMSLLEPILIVFLAVIVGSIVIALFLPILSLMDTGFGADKGEGEF